MKVYIKDYRLVIGDESVPNDTYGADALFEQIAFHVPCDTSGSRQIYIK